MAGQFLDGLSYSDFIKKELSKVDKKNKTIIEVVMAFCIAASVVGLFFMLVLLAKYA